MNRETIASAIRPEEGEGSMRVVELVLAVMAVVAAGILAFVR